MALLKLEVARLLLAESWQDVREAWLMDFAAQLFEEKHGFLAVVFRMGLL